MLVKNDPNYIHYPFVNDIHAQTAHTLADELHNDKSEYHVIDFKMTHHEVIELSLVLLSEPQFSSRAMKLITNPLEFLTTFGDCFKNVLLLLYCCIVNQQFHLKCQQDSLMRNVSVIMRN